MKVYIGPYINYIGPFQIAEKILFWKDPDSAEVDKLGDRLASIPGLDKLCNKIHKLRKRSIKVRIDGYDVWSMDSTLAYIILPMLYKLRDVKHGSPNVDEEDVPDHLKITTHDDFEQYLLPFYEEDEHDEYEIIHDRWDWVLNEIIWAFEQLNTDWESQYFDHSGVDYSKPIADMVHTIKYDDKGLKAHADRIHNGLRLFGKYYRCLWD